MNLNSHIHKKGNFYEIITFIYDSHSCCIVKRVQYSDTSYKGSKNGETTLKLVLCKGITMYKHLKLKKEMWKSLMKQLLKKVRFYYKLQKMIRLFMKKKSLLKRRFAFFEASKSGSYDLIVRVKGEKRKQKKFKYILSYEKR